MKKNVCIGGQLGYFIPKEEFEKGVFLNEESLKRFREKLIENDKLIVSLQSDLDMLQEAQE